MTNTLSIYRTTDTGKRMAEALSRCLKHNAGKLVLFLVSGGSALKVLDDIDHAVLGENITVSLVDDRFSTNPEVNNFLQLTRTEFYKQAKTRGTRFISSLPEEGESLEAASDRWGRALRQWASVHPSDRTVIATLGIGLDGHTAGIMPFPEDSQTFAALFEDKAKWVVGYDAGTKNPYPLRMTVSVLFLQTMIDYAFVYVSGEGKKNILRSVLKSNNIAENPASVLNSMKQVELYTDVDIENIKYNE